MFRDVMRGLGEWFHERRVTGPLWAVRGWEETHVAEIEAARTGAVLKFRAGAECLFRGRQTGSQWNLLGQAVGRPMRGRRLAPVPHGNHSWFAWSAFKPATRLVAMAVHTRGW